MVHYRSGMCVGKCLEGSWVDLVWSITGLSWMCVGECLEGS